MYSYEDRIRAVRLYIKLGERAGFINKAFDQQFMESLQTNPEWATQFSIHELVEKTWHPGRGTVDVAGHARRPHDGQRFGCAPGAQQLPHPDFQHRHRRAGAGKSGLKIAFKLSKK